ncbi:hypothetical protein ORI20_31440 [Mycobacterium sp. CVI_P3]|uniref:DUF5111 domain-containing protein n=1 Tax=Mycobacterium pinniadriaticum TaxID=2994102 RepID=A0ABT3SNW2_9MYCO|nr:hypothetical protein [Mycobacterium pinniadriaticum]MCX2934782.1 hypothetical protein [Mycobacterium pinniadriaticum]MCX2941219.1 hypothetical protein [Mycobacterium pinniadriaticum]
MTLETWSNWLLFTGGAVLVGAWVGTAFVKDRQIERWVYWFGSLLGGSFISLSVAARGWKAVVIAAVGITFITVLQAYFKTPYIRIRGRNHAFSMQDSAPDPTDDNAAEPPSAPPRDSYPGRVTAPKAWWLFVAIIGFLGFGGAVAGWDAKTLPAAGLICLGALVRGIDDATRKLPKARGQNLQATVATALSISMAFLPPVLYLVGYRIGTKRPMGYGLRDPVAPHYAKEDDE